MGEPVLGAVFVCVLVERHAPLGVPMRPILLVFVYQCLCLCRSGEACTPSCADAPHCVCAGVCVECAYVCVRVHASDWGEKDSTPFWGMLLVAL